MMTRIEAILIVLLIGACSSTPMGSLSPGDQELFGHYEMGDGLGVCAEVDLRADGTIKGRHCGGEHRGERSRTFRGSWSQSGDTLIFVTAKDDIGVSEVFYVNGIPAFVELQHKRDGEEPYWPLAFRKKEARPN